MENCLPEIELIYSSKYFGKPFYKIADSKGAFTVLLENWDERKIEFVEQFKILLLNRANMVLGIVEISTGATTYTAVEPKLIFVAAIKSNAHSIILCHNHPSGAIQPSVPDTKITDKLKQIGQLIEIKILDHLIISTSSYYSFSDNGLL